MPKALNTLAVGTKIEVPVNSAFQSRFGSKIVFKVADKNHSGYPANSVTLITDGIIQIMCVDGKEASNADANRKSLGNNRWIQTNLQQWLNSNAAAGAWYSAQHSADAPPNADTYSGSGNHYQAWAGFLQIFPADFVNALMTTTLTVAKNTVTDGGSYESFTSKMFLASNTEVGLANENSIAEGSLLALFTAADNNSRLAYPTTECLNNSNGYTNTNYGAGKAWYWWLRTPYAGYSYGVRYVGTSGALGGSSAYYGHYGVRPLCNLSSVILVSDNVNASGNYEIVWKQPPTAPNGISVPATCYSGQQINISWGAATQPDGDAITYTLERSINSAAYTQVTTTSGLSYADNVLTTWNTVRYRVKAVSGSLESAYITSSDSAVIHNQPPVISGQNGDLGTKTAPFGYDYSITDPDNDPVTSTERVDGKTIRTFNAMLGAKNTANVAGANFTSLGLGQHTLSITAQDNAGNSVVRNMTFTKWVDGFSIVLSPPLEADAIPSRVNIVIHRAIPAGAIFKVEVCNNPFDASPVWEDATTSVLQATAHVFENKTQYAIQSGLNIRVTVSRNNAIGECWVSGIGGNFE